MANRAIIENLIRLKCAIDTHTPQRMLALDSHSAYDMVISLDAAIEALSADRWIPCSERLPEEYGWYRVTTSGKNVTCRWYGTLHGWETFDDAVVAWLPNPEPYKGGK